MHGWPTLGLRPPSAAPTCPATRQGAAPGSVWLHRACRSRGPKSLRVVRGRGHLLSSPLHSHTHPIPLSVQAGALGTAAYMAPEAMHAGQITERCDVFAYGEALAHPGRPVPAREAAVVAKPATTVLASPAMLCACICSPPRRSAAVGAPHRASGLGGMRVAAAGHLCGGRGAAPPAHPARLPAAAGQAAQGGGQQHVCVVGDGHLHSHKKCNGWAFSCT